MFSPQAEALSREAGIAAAAIGQGINGISNATYAQQGYYHYAFFNLSIAFERLGKLVFLLDHLLSDGDYPTDAQLRKLGHNLSTIISNVDEIRTRRELRIEACPRNKISTGIIESLSSFAIATRYYNLDLLVNGKSAAMIEPIAHWYELVGKPIIDIHYTKRSRLKDEAIVKAFGPMMEEYTVVSHTREDGNGISSWTEGALASGHVRTMQRYSRMYCLGIARFLTNVVIELQYEALKKRHEVPHFSDFFGIFCNDDAYFLRRKSWDPYRP